MGGRRFESDHRLSLLRRFGAGAARFTRALAPSLSHLRNHRRLPPPAGSHTTVARCSAQQSLTPVSPRFVACSLPLEEPYLVFVTLFHQKQLALGAERLLLGALGD